MAGFKHILVPSDFSSASERALDLALDMAARYGASLDVLHVCAVPVYGYPGIGMGPPDLLSAVERAAKEELDRLMKRVLERLPSAKGSLQVGIPDAEIRRAIGEMGADLVVMGTHGRRGFQHAFLGSVAERTVRTSPVPVLTVRAPDKPDKDR